MQIPQCEYQFSSDLLCDPEQVIALPLWTSLMKLIQRMMMHTSAGCQALCSVLGTQGCWRRQWCPDLHSKAAPSHLRLGLSPRSKLGAHARKTRAMRADARHLAPSSQARGHLKGVFHAVSQGSSWTEHQLPQRQLACLAGEYLSKVCDTSLPGLTSSLCFLESPLNKPLALDNSSQGPLLEEEVKTETTGPIGYGIVPPAIHMLKPLSPISEWASIWRIGI